MSSASSFVSIEPIKVTGNDRNRYGQRQNAGNCARRTDQLSPVTDGHFVSVPDRRHGDNRPPESVRNTVNLRVRLAELGVVDGAGEDQQADAEGDQKQPESFEAGAEREHQDLESDGMFRQLEDADQPDDAQEGQRRARFGAFATHRGQNVEQRHVVRQDGHDVDDVLEIAPERQLRRTRDEPNDRLDGKPSRTRCLDQEERIEEVGQLSGYTVRHGEDWQRLDAEQNDGDESNDDRQNRNDERRPRRLRVLEQHPEPPQCHVGRQMNHFGCVTFGSLVLVDHIRLQLIEKQFVEEDVVWNVRWSTEPTAVLVIEKDRLEAGPVSVEEEFVLGAVEELGSLSTVAK